MSTASSPAPAPPSACCRRRTRPATTSRSSSACRSRSSSTIAGPDVCARPGHVGRPDRGGCDVSARGRDEAGAGAPTAARGHNPWLIALLVALATFMEVLDTTIANVALPLHRGRPRGQPRRGLLGGDELSGRQRDRADGSRLARRRAFGRKALLPDLPRALHGQLAAVRLRLEPASRSCCSASCRASAAAAWCRWRSRSWPTPSRRRSAARPSRCSASRWSWRRWSARRSAAGSPTTFSWHWCFLINGPVGLATIALIDRSSSLRPRTRSADGSAPGVRFDVVGFLLVATFLGSLEVVLDRGPEDDWFGSNFIITFAVIWRARLRADDPLGADAGGSDDRHAPGRPASVRRLLPGDARDRRDL